MAPSAAWLSIEASPCRAAGNSPTLVTFMFITQEATRDAKGKKSRVLVAEGGCSSHDTTVARQALDILFPGRQGQTFGSWCLGASA